jgi:NADPH:quinone reductase-like Zn-dependent oxidoreductase
MMKAAVYTRYGSPEVVRLKNVEKPVPKDNEVLIKIHAATVNRTDCGFRSANYFISRFWSGLLRPKYPILGCEFAGIVESIGKNVTEFKPGDKVFGYNDSKFGGHAEYIALPETDAITFIPANLDFYEAATMSEGAHYALNYVRATKVCEGKNVLINGATGAIGSAAVQLMKHFGARITAVCNTRNVDLIKSLGADRVIDYQTEDFTQIPEKFDIVFDAVGKNSFKNCKKLLTEKGIYVSTELGSKGANVFLAILTSFSKGKRVLFPIPDIRKDDLILLKTLAENGKFKPVIDRHYPLDEIVEAYQYVETGQKTGNVVITLI